MQSVNTGPDEPERRHWPEAIGRYSKADEAAYLRSFGRIQRRFCRKAIGCENKAKSQAVGVDEREHEEARIN